MAQRPVHIVGVGANTPLGRSAWATAAAVRAGISAMGEHPFMIDTAGESMKVVRAPWLEVDLGPAERMEALLLPAINEALEVVGKAGDLKIGLALGLPAQRPGLPSDLVSTLHATIMQRYPARFAGIAVFPSGHAAGLLGLEAAMKKLEQGAFDACVVAGVDSYLAPETLEWLEECDQLHGAGPLNNAWGFIPGEAAGAVCLVRAEVLQRLGWESLARVLGVATARESKRIKTETVCTGEGLTQAFRGVLQALPPNTKVTDVYCDMNGEPYRADEYGFTCLRTQELFESASDFVAPADCWGDVSAASGSLFLALATIAGRKSYAKGDCAFAWASSENGERAAALLNVS